MNVFEDITKYNINILEHIVFDACVKIIGSVGKPFIKKTKIYVDIQYYMPYSIFRNNIIRHIILHKEIIFGNGIVTEDAGLPVWRYPYEICEKEERSILHGF